jgi:hypothetical protein
MKTSSFVVQLIERLVMSETGFDVNESQGWSKLRFGISQQPGKHASKNLMRIAFE